VIIRKECKKHGFTDHWKLKNGRIKCKKCQQEYQRKHYKSKYYKSKAKSRKKFLYSFVNRLKSILKCSNCNENRFWVLDLHHINPLEKKRNIAIMINRGVAFKTLKKEIRKCKILCANCHRDFHYKEQIASGR